MIDKKIALTCKKNLMWAWAIAFYKLKIIMKTNRNKNLLKKHCTWTGLHYRGLCYTWSFLYLDYRSLCCTWTFTYLDFRSLCCSWTCLRYGNLCCTYTVRVYGTENWAVLVRTIGSLHECCSRHVFAIGAWTAPGRVYSRQKPGLFWATGAMLLLDLSRLQEPCATSGHI
jgi:hypothetical protein